MIRKLQRRFIRISVISLSVAMILVLIIVNVVNWVSVRGELNTTLDFISQDEARGLPLKDGEGSGEEPRFGSRPSARFSSGANKHQRNMVAQANWYCVSFDSQGALCGISGINSADDDVSAIKTLATEALESGKERGFSGDYLYKTVKNTDGGDSVFILNCETRLSSMRKLMLISALACLGAIIVTFIIVSVASRRAVAPTIKNMEQQKQFITNASHELKTPLTVISTNMELLDMETPGNQWVSATKKQTAVMRRLVDELVYLSRMEEESAPLEFETMQLKPLIEEVCEPFEAMAEYSGRELKISVEDGLRVNGDRASLQRLVSTLCDNAMKYAEGEGAVEISARAEGRHALITVSNEVKQPLGKEECARLFERFYRADASRSKNTKAGFGIGLAIARAIAEKHGGSIEAAMDGEKRLRFVCRLPVKGAA